MPTRRAPTDPRVRPWIAGMIAYLIISLIGNAVVQTELHGFYHAIICYFAAPIFIAALACGWFAQPWRSMTISPFKRIGWILLTSLLLTVSSGGLANYLNIGFGSGASVHFRGSIVRLRWSSGKGGSRYFVYITDSSTGKPAEFSINRQQYYSLHVGATYERNMKIGALGYAYR